MQSTGFCKNPAQGYSWMKILEEQKFEFEIEGSQGDIYEVIFLYDGDKEISGECTCPAGRYEDQCRHRLMILAGDSKNIVSDNLGDLKKFQKIFKGTPLEGAFKKLKELEKQQDDIKKKVKEAKKELGKLLNK